MNQTRTTSTPPRLHGPIASPLPARRALVDKRSFALWRSPWIAGLVLAIVAIVWASSIHISTGPAAGSAFEGARPSTSAPGSRTLRVGIFNIHGGRGRDRQRDLARTADCLRGLDIVGLNEVLGPKLWGQTDQSQQLGEVLGLSWLFAPTEFRWWDGSFGNGLLSGLPVTAWQRIPLPLAGSHTHRNVILSTVEVGGRPVHIVLTHLDSRDPARRQEQLRIVSEMFLSLQPPAILMGDMNTQPDNAQMQQLLAVPGVADALAGGMSAAPPSHRIDWILTRGLHSVRSGCEDLGASDHPLYWAELEIQD